MNILHINSNYRQSTLYQEMFQSLSKFDDLSGRVYFPIEKKSEILNDCNYLDTPKCIGDLDKYFFFRRNKKLFDNADRIYNFNEYEFMLAYSLFSNGYLARSLSKKHKVPYIVIVQNTDVNFYFKKMLFLKKIGIDVLKNASKVIFLSLSYQDYVLQKYLNDEERAIVMKKSIVIPFGIDNYWFHNLNQKMVLKNTHHINLLFVGKVNSNKNILTIIKACKELIKKGYTVKFTIVGNIENEKMSVTILKNNFVKYIPFVPKEKLIKIYRENDIFIMPSVKESFGLVYAEAMSQGLPVIYTKGQGFDKQFDDGKIGYSVHCFDVREIVNRIIDITRDYSIISDNCVSLVKKFKWSEIAFQYNKIFVANENKKGMGT